MIGPEMKSPLLSIIISTRNRQKYAISAINSILSISAHDLELVVHDNSDSRDLEEYIRSNINDNRLRYNYASTPSKMTDNWNTAVGLASGKYLCIIGDDDGINPEIIEATRWADMKDLDALKPTVLASYIWPESGIPSFLNVPKEGFITILPFSGKVTIPDPEIEMRKLVRSGGFKYLETEIPRIYHGIVKRKCLYKARERMGTFFGGLSPDIFAAVAIANFAENVVSIDYPLTIAGISKSSGSAQSIRGESVETLEYSLIYRYNTSTYKWAEIIPRFHCVKTVWADSTVAALKALGRDDIIQNFNLPLLGAYCMAAHPKYTRIILHDMYEHFRDNNMDQFEETFKFCYSFLIGPGLEMIKLIPKGLRIALLGCASGTKIGGVKDMVEATNALVVYLRKNKKIFSDFVP